MNESDARRHLRLSPTDEISSQDVKRAYRAAAKLHHPDVGEQPDAAQFRLAAEAAKLLKDGDRERTVDALLRTDAAAFGTRRRRPAPSADMSDVIDAMRTSIEDIFGPDFTSSRTPGPAEPLTVEHEFDGDVDHTFMRNLPAGATVEIIGLVKGYKITDADGNALPFKFS